MAEVVLSIPSNRAGATAVEHLVARGESDLGIRYLQSLSRRLTDQTNSRLADLDHSFHLVEVRDGGEVGAINRIMQWHNGEGDRRSLHGRVDAAEPNLRFRPSATLGLPFKLGGFHQNYLQRMNVGDAHRAGIKGKDIRVAVIDSGADDPSGVLLDDFYDVESGNPIHPAPKIDNDGHGTAMATLVREVAPEATILGIRVFDQDTLNLWNVLAGTGTAVFDCDADIVSISLGYAQMPAQCLACGASAQSRSLAFQYLLDGVTRSPGKRGTPPIYVAATGNDYSSAGFDYPAAYDSAVAIGSVNDGLARSAFSNYGKSAPKYFFMAPGGEENPLGAVTEDVGSGSQAPCRGTSVATAYAAGMLALLWSDPRYQGQAPDVFLASVKKHDRLPLPTASPDPHQYGSGLIQYPNAQASDTSEAQEEIKLLKVIELKPRCEG